MIRRFIIITLLLCSLALSIDAQETQQQNEGKAPGATATENKDAGVIVDNKNDQVSPKTVEESPVKEKEPAGVKKQKAKETESKAAKKKAEKTAQPIKEEEKGKEDNDTAPPFSGKGLLVVDEGAEVIRRIPGIVIAKTEDKTSTVVEIPSDTEQKAEPEDSSGFLGMSDEKTETMAKIAIVAIIFIIFLLYRVRSRRSGKRIVRTYLKK